MSNTEKTAKSPIKQYIPAIIVGAVVGLFVLNIGPLLTGYQGNDATNQVMIHVENASLQDIARLMKRPSNELVAALVAKKMVVNNLNQTLQDIAQLNKTEAQRVVAIVFSPQ